MVMVSVFLEYEPAGASMKVEVDTGGEQNLSSKSQSDCFCACKFIIRVRDGGRLFDGRVLGVCEQV